MSNKICDGTKKSVLEMFKNGVSKAEIAEKCGISTRSVGRIIDADRDSKNKQIAPIDSEPDTIDTILSHTIDGLNECTKRIDGVHFMLSCISDYYKTGPLTKNSLNLLINDLMRVNGRIDYLIEQVDCAKEMRKLM